MLIFSCNYSSQQKKSMENLIQTIKQLDIFSHGQFLRYRKEESYRTVTGGIVSVILMGLFCGIFANLAINTFKQTIITSEFQTSYEIDPSYYQLYTGPQSKFMFAVGISNLDLSSAKKYFQIELIKYNNSKTIEGNITKTTATKTKLQLSPCEISSWTNINHDIQQSFNKLNLTQWLCPKAGESLDLQGKYTSLNFQYSRISVSQCQPDPLIPEKCASKDQVAKFFTANSGLITINLYYVNTVINSGKVEYLTYYFEDQNYFKASQTQGIQSNLFFTHYSIQTDTSILPWSQSKVDTGVYLPNTAKSTIFPIPADNPTYAKIYFRKAANVYSVSRSFQKVDETLSYVGGLFGIIVVFCTVFSIYDKFAYQIQLGDRLFNKNKKGSFGSQNFNFIVYMGYGIFYMLNMIGIKLNWKTMKTYYECQSQSKKQLDVHLLLKKIAFFEQVSKLVLEQHHIKGLNLLPKPTIAEIKQRRKQFQIQSMIYHQLERKGRSIFIEKEEYNHQMQRFLRMNRSSLAYDIEGSQQEFQKQIVEISKNYHQLQKSRGTGDNISHKILGKIQLNNLCSAILRLTIRLNDERKLTIIHTNDKIIDDNQNISLSDSLSQARNRLKDYSFKLNFVTKNCDF